MTETETDRSPGNAPLRFLGSLSAALCVVLAMLWLALTVTGYADREQRAELQTHAVSLLGEAERWNLRELLGPPRIGEAPEVVPLLGAGGFDSSRPVRGVVRLDVRVDAAGEVTDVRVIDATPPGIYESQAVAEISRRRYEPEVVDGDAVPSRHLEIVDFAIEPAAGPDLGRD